MRFKHVVICYCAFLAVQALLFFLLFIARPSRTGVPPVDFLVLVSLLCLDLALAFAIALGYAARRLRRYRGEVGLLIAALVAAALIVPNAVIWRRMRAMQEARRELPSAASGFFDPTPIPEPYREVRHELHLGFASWAFADPKHPAHTILLNEWKSDSEVNCVPGAAMTKMPVRLEADYLDRPVTVRVRPLGDGLEESELLFSGRDFCLWLTASAATGEFTPERLVTLLKGFRQVP